MNIQFSKFKKNENWVKGTVDGGKYTFESKLYDESSEYGIDGGRVSKLNIQDKKGSWVMNYDRGWDIEPNTSEEKEVYLGVLNFLENAPTTRFGLE